LEEVGADNEKGLWESFVVEFQEQMQDYRTMVLAFAEGEEDCDLENAERRLRSIGQRLVQTAQDTKADATIKSRARQLLQYVSSYCQSHGREDLNAEFVAYIASCDEG
jgi:acetate kinase